jgi:hypothetical protein
MWAGIKLFLISLQTSPTHEFFERFQSHLCPFYIMHLRGQLAVAFVVSCCCPCFSAETNLCAFPCVSYSLPPMHLRAEPRSEAPRTESSAATRTVLSASSESLQSGDNSNTGEFHSRVFRSDRFYLTQSTTTLSDPGFVGFVEQVFKPEPVQFGKVSVMSPILTVAKTKNPLSLLSGFGTDCGLLTFNLLELSW